MYAIIIVRIVTRLRAGKPREIGLNLDGARNFFLKRSNRLWIPPRFTMEFSLVSKAPGVWSCLLNLSSVLFENKPKYISFHHTFSWSIQGKHDLFLWFNIVHPNI